MRHRVPSGLMALAVVCAAAAMGGCGLGAGRGGARASLTVTEHFGTEPVGTASAAAVPGSETVMRMLERHFRATTRYGGGFVQSIDGVAGGGQRDWFYYVNGIEGAVGAAEMTVHAGDRVWWDFHDWRATDSVPAVVGDYPEPFQHGFGGRRYVTALECAPDRSLAVACARVRAALAGVGVQAHRQPLGEPAGPGTLLVLVGPWQRLAATPGGALLGHPPGTSGVYARFTSSGSARLELLSPSGAAARTLRAGAGLIAATSVGGSVPVWLVTGTDAAGVEAAARRLAPGCLRAAFAVVVRGAQCTAVPLEAAL